MKTTLSGIITDIFPAVLRGNFETRQFRLKQTDAERYPNHWELECQQGDCNLLDSFKTGDQVNCAIEIRGRSWTKDGRTVIFNTLKCTEIAFFGQASKPAPSLRQQTGGIPSKAAGKEAEKLNDGTMKDTPTMWPGAKKLPEIDF